MESITEYWYTDDFDNNYTTSLTFEVVSIYYSQYKVLTDVGVLSDFLPNGTSTIETRV